MNKQAFRVAVIAFLALLLWVPMVPAGHGHVAPVLDYAFQPLGYRDDGLSSRSLAEKEDRVDAVVDALIDKVRRTGGLKLAVGTNGLDRLRYVENDDMTGEPEEVGKMLEISLGPASALLAKTGEQHAIALPLGLLAVLTQGDQIQVYAAVPETYVRIFFRDLGHTRGLERYMAMYRERLEEVAYAVLAKRGFELCASSSCSHMGTGPVLDEYTIPAIEGLVQMMTGDPEYTLSDYRYVGPTVTLPHGRRVTVRRVVAALEDAAEQGTVGDVNGDREINEDDGMALPLALMAAMGGDLDPLNEILGAAPSGVWGEDKALQNWDALRTLRVGGEVQLVELCQPFYAMTALSSPEFFHYLGLPCGAAVWEDAEGVKVTLANPVVVFSNLFSDSLGEICTQMDSIPCQIFTRFPMVVFNDLAAVLNGVLAEFGATEELGLYDILPLAMPTP